MVLFDDKIKDMRRLLSARSVSITHVPPVGYRRWRRGGGRMILEQDTGAELGNGRLPSFAALLWTEDLSLVRHGSISVCGPDIPCISSPGGLRSAPFGKLALLGCRPIGADSVYPAFELMDTVRFRLNLDGYMLRGFPQRNREWSRVSREACSKGFSFLTLGSELICEYCRLPFVLKAEMLFITDGDAIGALSPLADECLKITAALNHIFEKVEMDCVNCDSSEICADIDSQRAVRELRM